MFLQVFTATDLVFAVSVGRGSGTDYAFPLKEKQQTLEIIKINKFVLQ